MDLGATHPITGRQWQLTDDEGNAIWPDCTIVVPFGGRVSDATGKVINPGTYKTVQGGWTVEGTLETLELTDLVKNQKVPQVGAVWVAAPDGSEMPALHVLGDDPFSWLTPHTDVPASVSTTAFPLVDQDFGTGFARSVIGPARFGELLVDQPKPGGWLLPPPLPLLPGRVLYAPGADLSFSFPAGDAVALEQLELIVLARREEYGGGHGWQVDWALPIGRDWFLAALGLPVPAGGQPFTNPWPGLIAWVRYRQATDQVKTPARITLVPGHYELKLSGTTTGKAPTGQQDAASVPWSLTQRFWVTHPASLRPYVRFTTVGDTRLFGPRPGFDPTLGGVGFPAHRDYVTAVRFCVPYVGSMFPKLRMRVAYHSGTDISEDIAVAGNGAGESTLPPAAAAWKILHGGMVAADDEVAGAAALVPGPATLHVEYPAPDGELISLDTWSVHVSAFANAAHQLAWPGTCITRSYGPGGPQDIDPCTTLSKPAWHGHLAERPLAIRRMNDVHPGPHEPQAVTIASGRWRVNRSATLLPGVGIIGTVVQPDEYTTTPTSWVLDPALASLGGPLDADAALRFLQFLHRAGTRLAADPARPALDEIADPVASTRVEAIGGADGRVLALWLRTPEPLDWRRVTTAMRIRHVEPDTGCPTQYADRRPLLLDVHTIPGVDGSGALLVGVFAGTASVLPRGEVTLTLTYAPAVDGLVTLRPRTPPSGGKEQLSLTFLQPFGQPWPLPPPSGGGGKLHLPIDLLTPLAELQPLGPPSPGPVEAAAEAGA